MRAKVDQDLNNDESYYTIPNRYLPIWSSLNNSETEYLRGHHAIFTWWYPTLQTAMALPNVPVSLRQQSPSCRNLFSVGTP